MGVVESWHERIEFWGVFLALNIVIVTTLYFWYRKKSKFNSAMFAVNEQRLLNWKPYPLVEEEAEEENPHVMGKISKDMYNMGATSFLSLGDEKRMEMDTIAALRKYGVGSCGPRGFYGTIDVHLELEERLAKFVGVEEACVYSYGFSTIASAIPAYAKKNDLIFVDECVNFAIQKGLNASRSHIFYYRHNDMSHLEELLIANSSKILKKRSFIVAEGIYYNTGKMCPLKEIVELRKKYKLRLILDESLTIGVIGKSGRGLTEYFDVPVTDVDLIVGSLEHSFGSIGGFCAGSHFIVEHQRLSGLGYCFSASLPPLLSQAAITALEFIKNEPERLSSLCDNSLKLQEALGKLADFRISGDPLSPIKHLYLRSETIDSSDKYNYLKKIADYCVEKGMALSVSAYLKHVEVKCPEPSLRIASNTNLTSDQLDKMVTLLNSAYTYCC